MKQYIKNIVALTIIIASGSLNCGEKKATAEAAEKTYAKVAAVATVAAQTSVAPAGESAPAKVAATATAKPKAKAQPKAPAKKGNLLPRTDARMIAMPDLEENTNRTVPNPRTGTKAARREHPGYFINV